MAQPEILFSDRQQNCSPTIPCAAQTPPMPLLVFVYGSLKQGFPNTHLNTGVRRSGTFRTRERLPMYLLGAGRVPCMVLSPGTGHHVFGEVYEVTEDSLAIMDRLERLGEPGGYLRIAVEVEDVGARKPTAFTAHVYAKLPEQVASEAQRIGPLDEYTPEHAARLRW